MEFFDESVILDDSYRKKILQEITGPENQDRKTKAYKKYEIYKDRIKKYLLLRLQKEVDPETLVEMDSRTSVINIYKKVVNKKSHVYRTKPSRNIIKNQGDDEQLTKLVSCLNLDNEMKKVNRYVVAFRNCMVYVKPIMTKDGFYYKLVILAPHEYDVIEDPQDPSIPRVVILSQYNEDIVYSADNGNRTDGNTLTSNFRDGDNVDQEIADSPADMNQGKYVWWSDSYHFTTKKDGTIIANESPEELTNPIGRLPFVSFAMDQDNAFWSVGGEDLSDGAVLIGLLLTDLYFIAKLQGMGLFYYFGKNAPKAFKVGPGKAITADLKEGDPSPQIGFASANPPLGDHMAMIEQFIALLLTTNDLAVNSVQGSLNATTATSGIHEMIQNSEPINAIEDEQEQYRQKEPEILEIASRWQNVYKESTEGLISKFDDIGMMPEETSYVLTFPSPKMQLSEKEQADIDGIKLSQGIKNKVDLMLAENPDMSREDALASLIEKAQENMTLMANTMTTREDDAENEDSEDSEIESEGDQEE